MNYKQCGRIEFHEFQLPFWDLGFGVQLGVHPCGDVFLLNVGDTD